MINLVNNALKYAPQSTKIFVGIEKLDEHVKISVRDSGPGIAKDMVSQLFQRYVINQEGERRSGLGLGLYISSEIIKRHGGSIGVESVPGSGTTVWFTLPPLSDLTRATVN
jgi:signal transduction histidine kinase